MSQSLPLERIERLVRATPSLVGELRLDLVMQRVADLGRELLEARFSAIGLLAPDGRTLQSFTTSGMSDEEQALIGDAPTGRGVLGESIRTSQVIRLKKVADHPAAIGLPPHHPPIHSFLSVPVVGRHGTIGNLYLGEKIGADEFSEPDVHLAVLLASIVASAVENARYYEHTAHLLEEVQQLHRSRERFFAMVNHELRNSLAGVYGWAEMLVRKKDPQAVPRGAFEVLEAAEGAVSLVNDLLDLNRLDDDRLKPIIRQCDCCELIRSSVLRVTPAASEKGVTFLLPSCGGLPCWTDPHRVEQIFVNLFTNAIRHTPADSVITVTTETTADGVAFTVLDQGPGVAPDDTERIFDIYFTTAGHDRNAGHGVGLPLSRRLARLLGGDLMAVSRSGGGEFVLRLPLQATVKQSS